MESRATRMNTDQRTHNHPSARAIRPWPALCLALASLIPAGSAHAQAAKISYENGQLTIRANDVTLGEILAKVGVITKVTIEVPPTANAERLPVVELGPGPARHVLAALLGESGFDYLIQSADNNPDTLKSVLLIARERKGSGAADLASARGGRAPAKEEAPPAQPEEPPTLEASAPPQEAPPDPRPPSVQPDPPRTEGPLSAQQAIQLQQAQTDPNTLRPGAMAPPASLNQQSINQQLQQMYQQRAQMQQIQNQSTTVK